MARVPLISTAKHFYHGKVITVNEFFWAQNEKDADELTCRAIRFARKANPNEIPKSEQPKVEEAPKYETKPLEAEDSYEHSNLNAAEEIVEETEEGQQSRGNRQQRRQHNRRDFTKK